MPLDEHIAHDFLLGGLLQIASVESIKLVARLYEPDIGNPASGLVYVFIPDMHLTTRKVRDEKIHRGFNHERMFVDLIKQLVRLRNSSAGIPIYVFQLGDFLDLWRENTNDPERILQDFWGVYRCLHAADRQNRIDARFIIGNHDAPLIGCPYMSGAVHLQAFFPLNPEPKVYVTHGDILDPVEKLPDELQRFFVYQASGSGLDQLWGKLMGDDKANDLGHLIDVRQSTCYNIEDDQPVTIGPIQPMMMTRNLPERYNVNGQHKFHEPCMERVGHYNRENNLQMRAAVVAHTHRAGIFLDDDARFTMLDCGAWIGNHTLEDGGIKPNCQIGVVCGNDFRIYQLDADDNLSKQYEKNMIV